MAFRAGQEADNAATLALGQVHMPRLRQRLPFTISKYRQHGPRRLWDEVSRAFGRWLDAGRPRRERYGLTVTPRAQTVWLDDPGGADRWTVPG